MDANGADVPSVRVRVLCDQPVEGCEFIPDVHVTGGGKQQRIEYCWSRCVWKLHCACCKKTPVRLQCSVCVRLKLPTNNAYFCSAKCMQTSWASHSLRHRIKPPQEETNGNRSGNPDDHRQERDTNMDDLKNWHREQEQTLWHWLEIGRDVTYIPTAEDVGHVLRMSVVPYSENGVHRGKPVIVETAVTMPAPPPPPPRRMLNTRNMEIPSGRGSRSVNSVTFMSYNILAELYATPETYPYCPAWALAWPYRRENILREILTHNADLMCLQEVQADHNESFFQPQLQQCGYAGVYKCKTREFMGAYGKMDGCAIYWRRDRWQLADFPSAVTYIEFNAEARREYGAAAEAESRSGVDGANKKRLNRLLKDNVAVLVFLESTCIRRSGSSRKEVVCVANTHISANEDLSDVKLWQVSCFCNHIQKLMDRAEQRLGCPITLLVGGDFNSVPGSSPYGLLSEGSISEDHADAQHDPCNILYGLFQKKQLSHRLLLRSAYGVFGTKVQNIPLSTTSMWQNEAPYSNYTGHFIGTLDYLWYSYERLQLTSLLELVEESKLKECTALPSPQHSSDHLMLLAEFTFKSR